MSLSCDAAILVPVHGQRQEHLASVAMSVATSPRATSYLVQIRCARPEGHVAKLPPCHTTALVSPAPGKLVAPVANVIPRPELAQPPNSGTRKNQGGAPLVRHLARGG